LGRWAGGAWRKLWELGHFGKGAGIDPGQFRIPAEKVEVHAFGVDPTDNSVYVGDEPIKGEYRIQKFSATGLFLASVSFKPANPIGWRASRSTRKRTYLRARCHASQHGCIDRSQQTGC